MTAAPSARIGEDPSPLSAPPVKSIKATYDTLVNHRDECAMRYATDAAEYTMPWLKPDGITEAPRPWTQLGTQAVRSLGSTIHRITMPPQVKWIRMDMDPTERLAQEQKEAEANLPEGVSLISEIETRLADMENDLLTTMANFRVRSRTSSAIQRNLIEGTTGCAVDEETIRFIPLRRLVVFREGGEVVFWIFREEYVEDPYSVAPLKNDDERTYLYTMVDYRRRQVWQQREDEDPFLTAAKVAQYFVFVGQVPDVDHYPTSYVYDHLGLIKELNHLSERLAEAASVASWNVPVISEGAGITPTELKETKSGDPIVADIDSLSWFSSGLKFGDWNHVHAQRTVLREELSQLFALGIKDRVTRAATATEILQIAGELDTHTQDLLAALEETLQLALVKAFMAVRGFDEIVSETTDEPIKPIITTGQNALQRETSFNRMINTASVVKGSLDPTLGVDGLKVMERAGSALQFDAEGFFYRMQAAPGEGADGQQTPTGPDTASGDGGPQPGSPDASPEGAEVPQP